MFDMSVHHVCYHTMQSLAPMLTFLCTLQFSSRCFAMNTHLSDPCVLYLVTVCHGLFSEIHNTVYTQYILPRFCKLFLQILSCSFCSVGFQCTESCNIYTYCTCATCLSVRLSTSLSVTLVDCDHTWAGHHGHRLLVVVLCSLVD